MCGRYTQKEKVDNLLKILQISRMPQLKPRYNIAPNQMVACVRNVPGNSHRECVFLKWGLIPSWSKDASIGNKLINARGETVAEKPSFRRAFKSQRCLILADGFYEWKKEGKAKQPYYIGFKNHRPFAFAGLWERWDKGGTPTESCTIITTRPNTIMEPIYQRMPVIVDSQDYDLWLDPSLHDSTPLTPLLAPFCSKEMEAYPVSTLVNNPSNDQVECIQHLE